MNRWAGCLARAILLVVELVSIVGCVSFKPIPGMTFDQMDHMSKGAIYGELVHIRSEPPFEVYKTHRGTWSSSAPNEVLQEYYFRDNVLVAQSDVDKYRAELDRANESLQREQEQERVRKEKDQELKRNQEAAQEEACLSSAPVGICLYSDSTRFFRRLIEQDLANFTLNSELNSALGEINFMNTRNEMNSTTGIIYKVRNNNDYRIKDITITCFNVAESGTILGSHNQTFYIVVDPKQMREGSLVVPDVSQQISIACNVSSFSRF